MDLCTQDETAVQTDLSFLKAGIDFEKHSQFISKQYCSNKTRND